MHMTTSNFKSTVIFIALVLCCQTQTPRRSINPSYDHFQSHILYYQRTTNAHLYSSLTYTSSIELWGSIFDMQVLHTSTLNSISSSRHTHGFQIQTQITRINGNGYDITIANTAINQLNQPFVWYTIRFNVFLVPKGSPISIQTLTAMMYADLGDSVYYLTNTTYSLQFALSHSFKAECFWDSGKVYQDKMVIAPALNKVNIQKPTYLNLTSPTNWQYDWDMHTTSLNFSLIVSTYISRALYSVVKVVGVCPNSYKFTNSNFTLSFSSNNWFHIPPSTSGNILQTPIQLTTPFNGQPKLMLGMSITGMCLHHLNYPQTHISFNVSEAYDAFNNLKGTQGILKVRSLAPYEWFVSYWAIGLTGNCPTNFDVLNASHCYCNPSQNLTFDPIYPHKCRQLCPFGHYFNYQIELCQPCQLTYSYLCSTCNMTTCFNCTNGLDYYLKGITVLCLNCTLQFGIQCLSCTDEMCLNCNNSYVATLAGECRCQGDRYVAHGTGFCQLCNSTMPDCSNCTASGCLECARGYQLVNGNCLCTYPYLIVQGQCKNCSQLHGKGCLTCDLTSCLSCSPDLILTLNGSCHSCISLYGAHCLACSQIECLSCDSSFTLNISKVCACQIPSNFISNDTCISCSQLANCLTCDSSDCLSCSPSFSLVNGTCECPKGTFSSNGSCLNCSSFDPLCISCNSSICLQCPPIFVLVNSTCLCSADRYLVNESCVMCSLLGCQECSPSGQCHKCQSSFMLLNGSCECQPSLVLNGTVCLSCGQVFGNGCENCDVGSCSSCIIGYQLTSGLCSCVGPHSVIINGGCSPCSDLFAYCLSCTSATCLTCNIGYQLSNNSCLCSQGQYESLNGSCSTCSSSYKNCLNCSWDRCKTCFANYTLQNEECHCLPPMTNTTTNCMLCSDTQNPNDCSLTVQAQSLQNGHYLYFWLIYNHPSEAISHLIPLQYNLQIIINSSIIPHVLLDSSVFKMNIENIEENTPVHLNIKRQEFISYKQLKLSNQPQIINVQPVTPLLLSQDSIITILNIRNYFNGVLLILCFGTFNRIFQHSTLLSYSALSQPNSPNSLGSIFDLLHLHPIYTPLPLSTPFQNRHIPSKNLQLSAYSLNKPITNISFQLLVLCLCGFLLAIYVHNYLLVKRKPRRHRAFRNILNHSSEYIIENWICFLSILTFPTIYQIQLFIHNGFEDLQTRNGVNLAFSICLLLAITCFLIVYFMIFSAKVKRYSVFYFEFKSQKTLITILTLISLLRPYFISIFSLFLPWPNCQYSSLTYNFAYLFFIIICAPLCLSWVSYTFLITKTVLGTFVNMILIFGQEESILTRVAAYILITIIMVEIVQALCKLARLILRNKGVIEDKYQALEGEQEESKKMQIKKKMISFIDKARNQLGEMINKRKKKE